MISLSFCLSSWTEALNKIKGQSAKNKFVLFEPQNLILDIDRVDRLCDVCILHAEQTVQTKINTNKITVYKTVNLDDVAQFIHYFVCQ